MPRKPGSLDRELKAVTHSLRVLDRSLTHLAESIRSMPGPQAASATAVRHRRQALSPSRLRALRTHGKYMGFLRHLKPRQKAEVKALRAKKGVKVAIARARSLASK